MHYLGHQRKFFTLISLNADIVRLFGGFFTRFSEELCIFDLLLMCVLKDGTISLAVIVGGIFDFLLIHFDIEFVGK